MGLQKRGTYLLSLIMGLSLVASKASAAPESFVYEGVLEDTSGPITTSANLVLRIYDPAQACLLYEEGQIVTPASDGSFSIRVGSAIGGIKRTANDPGLNMGSVFASSGTVRGTGTANCAAGYVATSSDSRRLVINVNGSDLSPAIELSSAPFAMNAGSADKIGSYDSSKLLRTDGTASITALNDAKVTILQNLLNGTLSSSPSSSGEAASKGYVDNVASTLLPATTTFAGDVSGSFSTLSVNAIKGKAIDDTGITSGNVLKYNGTKWVMGADNVGSSLTLADGKIFVGNASGPAEVTLSGDATLSNTGVVTLATKLTAGGPVGAADYVPVITYDEKGRLTAVSSAAVNDSSKLALGGGTMSGAIAMGANDITNTGNITMGNNKYFTLSNNATNGTVAGQMWFDGNDIKFFAGGSVRTLGVAGAGITSFNGSTVSSQTFSVETSGVSPNWTTNAASGQHTLNIPMASASGSVTAGLLSNADYTAFNAKQSSALSAGKIWVGNGVGVAEAVSLSGDVETMSNTGLVTVKKTTSGTVNTILSLDNSGHATAQGFVAQGTGTVKILPPSVATNYQLRLPSATPGLGQVLQSDSSGNLSWVNMSAGGVTAVGVSSPLVDNGSAASPLLGLAAPPSGKPFYKWDGSNWIGSRLNVTDLLSSVDGISAQFPTGCLSHQTMIWISMADVYQCQDIKIPEMVKMTTAAMVLYVNAAGDDMTCNGFYSSGSGSAPNCAARTLQGALDKVPDIIKHNVTIYVESLGLMGPNQTLATINKAVTASDPVNGPFLKIEGNGGTTKTLYGSGSTGSVGLVIGPLSRGVYLKNLSIDGFREEGLSINGGLVLLENISMNDNSTAIRASGGAQVVHQGSSALQISLANLGSSDGSRGIEIHQAAMHTEIGLNMNVGSSQNNRGISISQGELGLEGGMSDIQSFASNYLTAIEISSGGTLYIENSHTLRVNMGNNSFASAINVRGGSLMSSGALELLNISGQGLVCESGAKCIIYGSFMANSGAGRPYVAVRGNSFMQAQGYFEIGGPEGSGSAGLEITDNSVFKYNPYMSGQTFTMTGSNNTGNVAIRLKNGGRFSFEAGMNTPTLDVANYEKLFEASANSSFTVEGNVGGISAVPGQAYVDETSVSKAQTNITFPVPSRACTGGLVPVGKGPGAFCIDSTSVGTNTYTGAVNDCSIRGLKLCSKIQYAQFCAAGNNLSAVHWSSGTEDVSCNNSSISATNNSNFGTNYTFRCCL